MNKTVKNQQRETKKLLEILTKRNLLTSFIEAQYLYISLPYKKKPNICNKFLTTPPTHHPPPRNN